MARFDFMPPQYFREKSRFNDVETAFFYGIIGQLAKITLGGFLTLQEFDKKRLIKNSKSPQSLNRSRLARRAAVANG